jgi:hypothetical protein
MRFSPPKSIRVTSLLLAERFVALTSEIVRTIPPDSLANSFYRFALPVFRPFGGAKFTKLDTGMDPTTFFEICVCGRTFSQPGPFHCHSRSCSKAKKRLSGALEKVKKTWGSRKRRHLETTNGEHSQMHREISPAIGNDTDAVRNTHIWNLFYLVFRYRICRSSPKIK